MVERPELSVWQRELESTLRHLVGPATALTERTAVVGREAASGRSQVWKWAVVIFASLLGGIVFGECSFLRPIDTLKKILESVRISEENSKNQNLEKLYEKLESLIEWSDSEVSNVEEKRKKAKEVFYNWVDKPADRKQSTEEGDLQNAFEKLFQEEGGKINPLGLLLKDEQETARALDLGKIDPVKLRKAFRALIDLRDIKLKPGDVGTKRYYGQALEELLREEQQEQLPPLPDGPPEPKFYVSNDLKYAERLKDLLSSEDWLSLIDVKPPDKKLGNLLSAIRDARRDKDSRVGEEGLKKEKNNATDPNVQIWYDKLDEFLGACAQAAPESADR